MSITISELRSNIYRLVDQVLEGGKPLRVKRKGRILTIQCERKEPKLSRLVRRDCMVGDPEELVHRDWSGAWNRDLP